MFLRSVILSFALMFAVASPAPVRADDAAVRAELVAQWRKMFEARDLAFSAVVSSTDKKGRVTRSDMRVNWPNRFHMKSAESEFIIIGDNTWMKPEGQGWMKFPMSMKKVIDQYTPEVMKASMDGMTNVRFVGDEEVNGVACKVYGYDFDRVLVDEIDGAAQVRFEPKDNPPTAAEIEARYDHSRPTVNPALLGK